ncbi:MAG: acetoacetate--CoA ligase, partial [bacterium]|nr:acetoacetate--CoA ligase [bacterium]
MSKGGDVLWSPTADQVASAPITALIETVNRRFGRSLATYADLHRWSVGAPSEFWSVVWDAAVGRGSIGDVVIGPGTIE